MLIQGVQRINDERAIGRYQFFVDLFPTFNSSDFHFLCHSQHRIFLFTLSLAFSLQSSHSDVTLSLNTLPLSFLPSSGVCFNLSLLAHSPTTPFSLILSLLQFFHNPLHLPSHTQEPGHYQYSPQEIRFTLPCAQSPRRKGQLSAKNPTHTHTHTSDYISVHCCQNLSHWRTLLGVTICVTLPTSDRQ